jgi:hypothetical protein
MKKNKWSYLVFIIVGLIAAVYFSCSRNTPGALRIVSINEASPLILDIADWGIAYDTLEAESVHTYHIAPDQIIPVEINYNEPGIGLPTYPTTYTARITDYTVKFSPIGHPKLILQSVSGATNISIQSGLTGNTKAQLKMVPSEWMGLYYDSLAPGLMVKATVIVSGYEELTRNVIADTGMFTINFADSYDDPFNFGSK